MRAVRRPTIEEILGPGGALSVVSSAFEVRAGQLDFAHAAARILDEGGILLAEAGTGTGKTLAYLAAAVASGRRVVISTATRTLQDQIVRQDVPRLEAALGRDCVTALLKGRSNYLCLLRLDEQRNLPPREWAPELPGVLEWSAITASGDRSEHAALAEAHPLWDRLTTTSETCLGGRCSLYTRCFVTRARAAAEAADIVVVNHHLYFGDAAVRAAGGELLPAHDAAIFDEAHTVAETAAQFFGRQVSTHRLGAFATDLHKAAEALPRDSNDRRGLLAVCLDVAAAAEPLFRAIRAAGSPGQDAPRLPWSDADVGDALRDLHLQLDTMLLAAEEALSAFGGRPGMETLSLLATRARTLRDDLDLLVEARTAGWVFFRESRGPHVTLSGQPIEAAGPMRAHVLDTLPAAIFTSATLTVDGTFDFIRARLGVPDDAAALELGRSVTAALYPSPFDYGEQARLYLPGHLPAPETPGFAEAAEAEIRALCGLTQGRAFVLFTSHRALDAMHRRLTQAGRAPFPYPIFRQGDGPRTTLVEMFRRTPGAVLLGTATFWEGVDVPGDALSLVVIDKLPFEAPNDPVLQARLEQCKERGGNPFADVQIPAAALALKQGFGRLIRTMTDRGIVAVLDVRLTQRGYGRKILRSLPPAPVVGNFATLASWWSGRVSQD